LPGEGEEGGREGGRGGVGGPGLEVEGVRKGGSEEVGDGFHDLRREGGRKGGRMIRMTYKVRCVELLEDLSILVIPSIPPSLPPSFLTVACNLSVGW